jgi:hypothetical protein
MSDASQRERTVQFDFDRKRRRIAMGFVPLYEGDGLLRKTIRSYHRAYGMRTGRSDTDFEKFKDAYHGS